MPLIQSVQQRNYFTAYCNQYTVLVRKLQNRKNTNKSRTVNSLFHHPSPPFCFSQQPVSTALPYSVAYVADLHWRRSSWHCYFSHSGVPFWNCVVLLSVDLKLRRHSGSMSSRLCMQLYSEQKQVTHCFQTIRSVCFPS